MAKSSVREYAILYVGGKRIGVGSAAGGNVLLNAGVHALDGPEHTGQLPADRVSVEDTGNHYTATDAEAALAEIFTDLDAHLTDTTDAHDASAVSIVDAGNHYTSTDVEGALQEVAVSVASIHGYEPVMVTSPNLVTTDGTSVWVPLVLTNGSPVLVAI